MTTGHVITDVRYNPDNARTRWLGYFDFLGTEKLIETGEHLKIFSIYAKAIDEVKRRNITLQCVDHAWFSDTFVFYTDDRSLSSWSELDHICRWFFYFLIDVGIPARGAISLGEFYVDKEEYVFFGKALTEAHRYGEAQNWLGFVLCPSAENNLRRSGQFTGKYCNYAYTDVPYVETEENLVKRLPACIVGNWFDIQEENPTLKNLFTMKSNIAGKAIVAKYDNSIEFLQRTLEERLYMKQTDALQTGFLRKQQS
ncbi:MAG: hypothetical protein Q8S00_12950 [Deltaproteobacteria bacterium]|nr:hypothetical protein [Deltaproteobacteria bacterium]MDZ4344858.1 hypothetical protein [Candidatus Binatia bacterium]